MVIWLGNVVQEVSAIEKIMKLKLDALENERINVPACLLRRQTAEPASHRLVGCRILASSRSS